MTVRGCCRLRSGCAPPPALPLLGAGWAGSAFGRTVAILRDNARTRYNLYSVGAEIGLALLIGAPWAFWILG